MTDNQKRILEMLADKKITVAEAQRLLSLVDPEEEIDAVNSDTDPERKRKPRFFRILVKPAPGTEGEDVNVRIPTTLIRAGMKLSALIPACAADEINEALRKEGIDFDISKLKDEDFEELAEALNDLEVDIHGGKEKVHIYAE
jgi:hypothetical protein